MVFDKFRKLQQRPSYKDIISPCLELYEQRQYEAVIVRLLSVLEMYPDDANTYYYLAASYAILGQAEQAQDCMGHIPPSVYKEQLNARTQQAVRHFDRQEYAKALILCKELTYLQPENMVAYRLQGQIHLQRKNYAQATVEFEHALRINPNDAVTYRDLGLVAREQGHNQKAATLVSRAIALDAKDGVTYISRAYVYIETKKYEEAWQDLNKAYKLLSSSDVRLQECFGHFYLAQGDYEQAIIYFRKAQNAVAQPGIFYHNIGVAYIGLGDVQQAKIHFARALSQRFDVTAAWMLDSVKMIDHPFDDEMAERLREIAIDHSYDTRSHLCLGAALWYEKKYEEALDQFEHAYALHPSQEATALLWMGIVHGSQHNDQAAHQFLTQAAESLPPLRFAPLRFDRPDLYEIYVTKKLA